MKFRFDFSWGFALYAFLCTALAMWMFPVIWRITKFALACAVLAIVMMAFKDMWQTMVGNRMRR